MDWFKLTVTGPATQDLQVELAECERDKLLVTFGQIERGTVPLHLLQISAGV